MPQHRGTSINAIVTRYASGGPCAECATSNFAFGIQLVSFPVQWAEWLRIPLEHAVAEGDKDLALTLLKAGASGGSGWKGCDDPTLLQVAAEGGNEVVVRTLLDIAGTEELDAVSGDKDKRTALHSAAAGGYTDAARMLELAGAKGGHLQLAGDFVIAGADLEAKDGDGNTPLHFAAAHDSDTFIGTLRRGVCVLVVSNKGEHPLHIAVDHDDMTVRKALLKAGTDPNVRYGSDKIFSPLNLARGNAAMTRTLLGSGADVKSVCELGHASLHWAAGHGVLEVVDALVEGRAKVEARSLGVVLSEQDHGFQGLAPLHVAAYWEKLGTLLALLQDGTNANTPDTDGRGPLHLGVVHPTFPIVLLQKPHDCLK
ncbi:unnamed protein product [Ectocarpus sp. CCAP 1310/34]|nr:unnamed protein product [Ectocarpus sp. CCAP 1310/34]